MAELFSDEWMKKFMEQWNAEPDLSDALAKINFNSTIGYGFDKEDKPRGILVVKDGKATAAGVYANEELNWDLRATEASWKQWLEKGIGMAGLGMAYVSGKMKFKKGDYAAMIKDPRMATPFIKSFTVMGQVK
jgi:putative sterol carrier protein